MRFFLANDETTIPFDSVCILFLASARLLTVSFFTMKFDTRSIITFALLCNATTSGSHFQGYDKDEDLVEQSVQTSGVEGDDAEFWERFLGYYYKKKKRPTPAPTDFSITNQPTQPPTQPPTQLPTQNPVCLVDIEVDCVLANDGTPCEDVPVVDGTCADGMESISAVSFTYQPATCSESENTQGPEATCTDSTTSIPSGNVTIICSDESGNIALGTSPPSVASGDEFSVSPVGGGSNPLPDKIVCTIRDGQTVVQTNVINTSGDVRLDLKDTFGALQLESCDQNDCVKQVLLTYTITNIGTVEMEVTSVTGQVINSDLVNNDAIFELVDLVIPNPIPMGDSVPVQHLTDIDFCTGQIATITANASALPDSPFPFPCVANDTVTFETPVLTKTPTQAPTQPPTEQPTEPPTEQPTEPPTQAPTENPVCLVNVAVDCVLTNGTTACQDVPEVDGTCIDDGQPISVVSFTYQPATCGSSENTQGSSATCMEMATTPSNNVTISCTDASGLMSLVTSPDSVGPGDEFTVMPMGGGSTPLPNKIFCSIGDD
eukprot:scaffold44974_cov176-Amphora_coffeaeformis.AAC.1